MLTDLRYALRSLRRSPAFALTVIGTIALGLGINVAVFTMFNAYVLRPLGVRDPYSLYSFTWRNQGGRFHAFSKAEYEQFRRENHVFSEVFGIRKQLVARIDGRPAYGMLVTEDYFSSLGVQAVLGRTLIPENAQQPGREAVVVLSHAYWQSHFGADLDIIGKELVVRGYPCEIIGVLPQGFGGLDLFPHDFWAPLALAPFVDDGAPRLEIVGRLKPGATVTAAEAALMAWAQAVTADRRADEKAVSVLLESRATSIPRTPLTVALFAPILAAFALVMLIACANVANMMLARAVARQREIGIRLSLGATRSRVVCQLLAESILLTAPAAVGAFIISLWTLDAGVRLLMAGMPPEYAEYMRLPPFSPDVRVFAFMSGAAVVSALLFGLVPALQVTRPNLVRAARGEFMYDTGRARPRNALVVMQITASACLLICAIVLLRASNRFANVETGLRTRDVIEIHVREKARPHVLQALESMPLTHVAAVSSVPLDASAPRVPVAAVGDSLLVRAAYRFASPEFFAVFDIPLAIGRHFTQQESVAGAAVAIISQTTAQRLWPNQDAIGNSLRIAADDRTAGDSKIRTYSTLEVVGIARDIVTGFGDSEADRTAIYLPTSARDSGNAVLVRVSGNVEAARTHLDQALSAAYPGAIDHIHTMQALAVGRVFPLRVAYWVSAVLGALALLLTISGIYGLLSYLVTQRTREIGIRMALGATVRAVVRLVLAHSLRLAMLGLFIGSAIAVGASQLFAARLLKIASFDAVAYVLGAMIVLTACMAAACVPALRAARVPPLTTLRHE